MEFDLNQAKDIVTNGMNEAQELLQDSSKVDALLIALEERLKELPVAGPVLANIPLTVSLVKSFIGKEYTEVPVRVIVTLVSSFIYIVKRKDLVPDYIPVVGYVDDVSVLGFALKFCEPELEAYRQWRDEKLQKQADDEAEQEDGEAAQGPDRGRAETGAGPGGRSQRQPGAAAADDGNVRPARSKTLHAPNRSVHR